MVLDAPRLLRVLEQRRKELRAAESAVTALALEGAFDHVALYAQAAADRAASRHAGVFASPALEEALAMAAAAIEPLKPTDSDFDRSADPRRVLHVATA